MEVLDMNQVRTYRATTLIERVPMIADKKDAFLSGFAGGFSTQIGDAREGVYIGSKQNASIWNGDSRCVMERVKSLGRLILDPVMTALKLAVARPLAIGFHAIGVIFNLCTCDMRGVARNVGGILGNILSYPFELMAVTLRAIKAVIGIIYPALVVGQPSFKSFSIETFVEDSYVGMEKIFNKAIKACGGKERCVVNLYTANQGKIELGESLAARDRNFVASRGSSSRSLSSGEFGGADAL